MDSDEIGRRFDIAVVNEAQSEWIGDLRAEARQLSIAINEFLPDGREKSLALTKIEEAVFWAVAGVVRPPVERPF